MDRPASQFSSLFHRDRAARAFGREVFQKARFRLQWRWRTLFGKLRARDPELTEGELRDLFRNVLPKIQVDGGPLCHFPARGRTITFHGKTHGLIRRAMRPGRPSAS